MLRIRTEEAREQGFTLIELLIVIVVLGLLAGIVTLGVTKFSDDATAATCTATQDNLQIAADAFAAQNGGTAATTYAQIDVYTKAGDGSAAPAGFSISGGTVSLGC